MRKASLPTVLLFCLSVNLATDVVRGDWPQWRGPNRAARTTEFAAPANWPKQLIQSWKVTVGEGVASPSLVGEKLYIFARQDGNEILRCLHAKNGDEIWKAEYAAEAVRGPASSFDGPRCSPTVIEGKVITLGAQGMLSCYDAEDGHLIWQNEDNVGDTPRFATSSSPIVVDGLVITEFGRDEAGGIAAYDLQAGEEKWKWTGSGATYGSPVQMNLNGEKAVVAPTAEQLVMLAVADGRVLWEMPYRQGRYNSATPILSENMLIIAGPTSGVTALKLTKSDEEVESQEAWKNRDNSLAFDTPVVSNGKLYGISALNSLFCINIESGATAWNTPLGVDGQADQQVTRERRDREGDAETQNEDGERRRRGRRGGRRGGRGGGGYGSVVDIGPALLALIPTGQLTVFAPGEEYSPLATYQVAAAGAYAYPVPSEFGIFVKDQDSVTLWTTE